MPVKERAKKAYPILTPARARELLDYDPETGIFTWRVTRTNIPAGTQAGYVGPDGYGQLRIDMRLYKTHRLAWFWVNGEWPPVHVDHINGDPSDNRITNLRLADEAQNARNARMKKSNKIGVKGVSWDASKRRWRADICVDRKRIALGRFNTIHEAQAAYQGAAELLHGDYARVA